VNSVLIIVYTDDTIVTGPVQSEIDRAVADISTLIDITVKDTVDDFLGVKITRDLANNSVCLTQPQLIDSILSNLKLQLESNKRNLPALVDTILHQFSRKIELP
jgi:hypothetical protein